MKLRFLVKLIFQNMTKDRPGFRKTSEDLDPPPSALRDASMGLRSGPEYDRLELRILH